MHRWLRVVGVLVVAAAFIAYHVLTWGWGLGHIAADLVFLLIVIAGALVWNAVKPRR